MIHRLEEQEPPREVRKFSRHSEREHESKRLLVLIERVKRQLAALPLPPPKAA